MTHFVLSAGVLLHRTGPDGAVQVLIAHMGGPFWARKDDGAWSIPKGEHDPRRGPRGRRPARVRRGARLARARRRLRDLGTVRQRAARCVAAFALEGDLDVDRVAATRSSSSGRRGRAGCRSSRRSTARRGSREDARAKIVKSQRPFLDRI